MKLDTTHKAVLTPRVNGIALQGCNTVVIQNVTFNNFANAIKADTATNSNVTIANCNDQGCWAFCTADHMAN